MYDTCVGCGARWEGRDTVHDPGCAFAGAPEAPAKVIIDRWTGKYRCFSNFFIEPDGTHVEGEYQASKAVDASTRVKFDGLSPRGAKELGNLIRRRPDWEVVKIPIMRELVRRKFREHPELAKILLSTGEAELVEENKHGDIFWGRVRGSGANWLGRILMEVRDELRLLVHV
jgi:ribA/ribD-fused uncharacterized protein